MLNQQKLKEGCSSTRKLHRTTPKDTPGLKMVVQAPLDDVRLSAPFCDKTGSAVNWFSCDKTCTFLQHILASDGTDVRLQKKAVFLVTDLADFQLNSGNSGLAFLSERVFLKLMVDMLSKFDLDLQEKVLLAIRSLLNLPTTDSRDMESCDLDGVLYRLGVQLEELASEEQKEYAGEVDALRREVQTLYQQKLKEGRSTATLAAL
uniref:Uncharacterized protein n=1 Tax=Avena sativa TaxID=4498 RepID=A0ACD5XU45_AVESA